MLFLVDTELTYNYSCVYSTFIREYISMYSTCILKAILETHNYFIKLYIINTTVYTSCLHFIIIYNSISNI